ACLRGAHEGGKVLLLSDVATHMPGAGDLRRRVRWRDLVAFLRLAAKSSPFESHTETRGPTKRGVSLVRSSGASIVSASRLRDAHPLADGWVSLAPKSYARSSMRANPCPNVASGSMMLALPGFSRLNLGATQV